MENLMTQIGVPSIVVLLILKEVFNFLRNRNGKSNGGFTHDMGIKFWSMANQTEKMYEMHNKVDHNGVPVWYVRHSLEDVIKQLADGITPLAGVLAEMQRDMKTIKEDLSKLKGK